MTEKNLLPPPIDESDEPFQSEADFLHYLTAACIQRGMTVDFTDDCASLSGTTDLISTDTIVERVHFETHTATPYQIGRQAAVVNLSDLAGSGGQPEWVLLSLQLPSGWFGTKLRELCAGFLDELMTHQTSLVGGNCCHAEGPLSVGVTVGGPLFGPHAILRSGASAGDLIYVSGQLGAAAAMLVDCTPENIELRHRWRPHVAESRQLCEAGQVTAMMDISDGLLVDAQRLARASGVSLHITTPNLPLIKTVPEKDALTHALYGGEDYVLLFTLPSDAQPPRWATQIGVVQFGSGVVVDGQLISQVGFDHFRAGGEGAP